MTAASLLARLDALGVSAKADGGSLHLRPASAIPADLLGVLRTHKAELLALLTSLANDPLAPCLNCGCGLWWRLSVTSGGPGPWRCSKCDPAPDDVWQDATAVPVSRNCKGSGE